MDDALKHARINTTVKISNALFLCAWLLLIAAVLTSSWRIAGVGLLTLLPAGVLALGCYGLRQRLTNSKTTS